MLLCCLSLLSFAQNHPYLLQLVDHSARSSFGAVDQIFQDSLGIIWMGVKGHGLAYYDGRELQKIEVQKDDVFSQNHVVFKGSEERMFMHVGRKVLVFDPIQKAFSDSINLATSIGSEWSIVEIFPRPDESEVWALLRHQDALHREQLIVRSAGFEPFMPLKTTLINGSDIPVAVFHRDGMVFKTPEGFLEIDGAGESLQFYPMPPNVMERSLHQKNTAYLSPGRIYLSDASRARYVGYDVPIDPCYVLDLNSGEFEEVGGMDEELLLINTHKEELVGINANSLFRYNPKQDKWSDVELIPSREEDQYGTGAFHFVMDRYSDVIWVGGEEGLVKLVPTHHGVELLTCRAPRGMTEDENGVIYASAVSQVQVMGVIDLWYGHIRYDPKTGIQTNHAYPTRFDRFSLTYLPERGFFCSKYIIHEELQTWEEVGDSRFQEFLADTISSHAVFIHEQDNDGNWWMSRWFDHRVFKMSPNLDSLLMMVEVPDISGHDIQINQLYCSPLDGSMWLGTRGKGAYVISKEGKLTMQLSTHDEADVRLPDNYVCDFYQSGDGTMWVGSESGISELNLGTGEVNTYQLNSDHEEFNLVYSILASHSGDNLWLATNRGLYVFSPESKLSYRLSLHPKMNIAEFNRVSAYESRDGYFHFGAVTQGTLAAGVFRFHPDTVLNYYRNANVGRQKIILNELSIYNQDDQVETTTTLPKLDQIELAPTDRYFRLSFSTSDFRSPEENVYTYFLEGYDDHWSEASKSNFEMQYENLPPGTYKLRLRGALIREDLEASERVILVVSRPFWYNTWWARTVFVVIALLIVIYFYRQTLERRLQRSEAEKLKEIDKLRTRLYTNITHEFRTPLTVMMGMADGISSEPDKVVFNRNGEQLLNLVNQILDVSKAEAGQLELNKKHGDVIPFLIQVSESFQTHAIQHGINLGVRSQIGSLFMDFDAERMVQILNNLLSNAIKFTGDSGQVEVELRHQLGEKELLIIEVRDTGIGMDREQLAHAFDRFYQADDSSVRAGEGTGIGLALTKELVDLMEGEIQVGSVKNHGTAFTVSIPVFREAQHEETKVSLNNTDQVDVEASLDAENNQPLVLLVEDNQDLVYYISSVIESDYRVITAGNGREGIEVAIEQIPDLIITDVMMPEVDGIELCGTLKNDSRTSHIPIVMLTAKVTQEDELRGLQTGADIYITKPFSSEVLQLHLRNLLKMRAEIQRRFQQMIGQQAGNVKSVLPAEPSRDDQFIVELRDLVKSRLDDDELSGVDLCDKAALSQTQLYRKLKALTGESPSVFIRNIRLEESLIHLRTNELTISEITYSVGLKDPNYYSRLFGERYNMTPTEYRNQFQETK